VSVQQYFYGLADFLTQKLRGQEVFLANLSGEESDFVRFNGAKVRQAGGVKQASLSLRLIDGKRNAIASVTLSHERAEDEGRLAAVVATLRDQVAALPEDPYLMFASEVRSSAQIKKRELEAGPAIVSRIAEACKTLDLVGIYAGGGIYRGFANSFGQRNWFETVSFNLDWSLYLRADKAVKSGYAGFNWRDEDFARKIDDARSQLAVLEKEPRTIKPGRYRVYLAPKAFTEVTDMMCWGGFSMKAHRTKQTPLLRMVEADAHMNAAVTMLENTGGGLSPNFNSAGYVKPDRVVLIDAGRYKDCLVSPRSAMEYSVSTNGANGGEGPESLTVEAGTLPADRVLTELKEGIYVNNLWYLNFSDRSACRVTGMTRFASFWVENGKIVAPLNVMRFDESVLKMLGDKLVGLTAERELLLSAGTYGERQTGSAHLPGALVDDFSLTL
jgi:predicted Zn-dependent protease